MFKRIYARAVIIVFLVYVFNSLNVVAFYHNPRVRGSSPCAATKLSMQSVIVVRIPRATPY